ncbi:MAG TPA: DegT/DnrJ/EryC1/StrS family aminotransferase [Syntrophorhabdaceae bacterium]|nr:DegT/DnrJ/EryC1/StrS family aminotransferase [Syntrophorhabdaceae bacterium]
MIPVAKPYLTSDDAQSAYDTILTGWVTQGPKVQEFEEHFAAYVGSRYAVAVSSCTTALHLAMLVVGVGPGDEVICPSLSYIATSNSILYTGARPVFAEVLPVTYNIDAGYAESLITSRTKAILIVHQMGMPADIDAFKRLCETYKLHLVEDAACAVGSTYKGRKIGCHSDLVCFSFHPRKVITTGDGGMITTSRRDYAERLRRLRQHGMSVSDRERHAANKVVFEQHLEVGYNYRMTDIQAAVGIKQLEKLDWIITQRRRIADRYNEAFAEIDCLTVPKEEPGLLSNYQSYCLYVKETAPISRNDLMASLLEKGISTRRGIMTSHRERAYKDICAGLRLPASEGLSDRSIILPLYVGMTDADIDQVVHSIGQIMKGHCLPTEATPAPRLTHEGHQGSIPN